VLASDRYVTLDRLAVGGMGEVFLARQEGAGGFRRTVVLKRLLPDAEGNDEAVSRLLDEARIVAALAHENVVSIIEIGEHRDARGVRDLREPPFLALEYVHGENCGTLRVRAYKRGLQMPVVVAARIVADAARGLHHAHVAKDVDGSPLHIVHRDVAPKNILVRHDGVSKITDFGIAWSLDRLSRTATGNVAGTLTYMSPEQVAGKPVDGKSDQFALGVVLWELLAGKRLFKAETPVGTVEKILTEQVEAPSEHRPEVPRALDDIALRMLSRDPADRFVDCDEVAGAIEHALPDASMTVGRAAVAVFLEQVVGEDMRERQKRIESGAAHPMYASRVDADEGTRSVSSSVDSVRAPRDENTVEHATQTSATANKPVAVVQAPSSTSNVAARTPRSVLAAAAVAAAFVFGLVVAVAVFWPREDPSTLATRELLVQTLDWGDLVLREMLVVHAVNAGVPSAKADEVASRLVELHKQRLALLLAHWRNDAATRERERAALLEREKEIVAQAKMVIATLDAPALPDVPASVRTFLMTRWTWDSSVPIRWVPPPSLDEIQRELLAGDELSDENKALRRQIVDAIARRAHVEPALVHGLIDAFVNEREEVLERFKRAPHGELKGLEDRARTLADAGRDALQAKLPEKLAKALANAAFVSVSESTEADMWFDDEITVD
jgi:serine/threonine protein kinase